MADLLFLTIIALIALFWADHRRAQDIAITHTRKMCELVGVQFLDETAAFGKIRFGRDDHGVLRLRRTFTFEYSTERGDRCHGALIMLGHAPLTFELEDRAIIDSTTDG